MALELFESWLNQQPTMVAAIGGGIAVITLLFWVLVFWRLKRYRYLIRDHGSKNLEELLLKLAAQVDSIEQRLTKLEKRTVQNQTQAEKHIQRWGLVRFQAFENTGSDQSFSLALLDAAGDGVVISSIFGREESRAYGKLIQNGQSSYPLSAEEREAIAKALQRQK